MGRSKAPKIELRRLKVAELLAANPNISIRRIAREIGCSSNTAFFDVHAVRKEWADRRVELYESRLAEDIARTDEIIKILWPRIQAGDLPSVDRYLAVASYRARVLGVEGQRQELDVGAVLASYLSRLAEGGGGSGGGGSAS